MWWRDRPPPIMTLTRRHFFSTLAAAPFAAAQSARRVAITIDDGPVVGDGGDLATYQRVTAGLVSSFSAEKVPVVLFINERQLNVHGQRDARAEALIQWLDAGFEIGNHTYAHADLNRVPLWQYLDGIAQGEVILRPLLQRRGQKLVWFRHPFLRTGATADAVKAIEEFLDQRGYRIAPVTVDYADYSFAGVYSRLQRSGDKATADKVYHAYLDQVDLGFAHSEKLSMEVLGYEIPQILLIHCNELNSVSLRDSIARIRKRGYTFITLDEAMRDPAYQRRDDYLGTSGAGWLRRWGLSMGKQMTPGPQMPQWIQDLPRQERQQP
jgi:peptidoglycan/xylan/chitin deacetylase (PgdA/CDA1 family)